jgi:hypothetical protein
VLQVVNVKNEPILLSNLILKIQQKSSPKIRASCETLKNGPKWPKEAKIGPKLGPILLP